MSTILIQFAYLVAAILFILGLRNLSSPRTAPRGNLLAAIGTGNESFTSHEQMAAAYLAVGYLHGKIISSGFPDGIKRPPHTDGVSERLGK